MCAYVCAMYVCVTRYRVLSRVSFPCQYSNTSGVKKNELMQSRPAAPAVPAVHPVPAVATHPARAATVARLPPALVVVDEGRRTTGIPRLRNNPCGIQKTPKTLLVFAQNGSFHRHSAVRPAALSPPRREAYRRRLEVPLGPTWWAHLPGLNSTHDPKWPDPTDQSPGKTRTPAGVLGSCVAPSHRRPPYATPRSPCQEGHAGRLPLGGDRLRNLLREVAAFLLRPSVRSHATWQDQCLRTVVLPRRRYHERLPPLAQR